VGQRPALHGAAGGRFGGSEGGQKRNGHRRLILKVFDYKGEEPRKKTEGHRWADMKVTTAENAYTGKGGSKR